MIAACLLLAVLSVVSSDGKVRCDFDAAGGFPRVEVSRDGLSFGAVEVGPDYTARGHGNYVVKSSAVRRCAGSWRPVWGTRAEYPDNYAELKVELAAQGGGEAELSVAVRAYDEGIAVRYEMPLETYALDEIRRDRIDFALPPETVAWPIRETEGTYPEEPVPVASLDVGADWRMPLTLRTRDGLFACILEAHTVKWPRSFLRADGAGGLKSVYAVGTKTGREVAVSPWRVVLLSPSAGGLVERAHLVENLNPPCAVPDAAEWVRPGLTTADFGRLDNASLLSDARRAREAGVRYLQIDWGWYGTERPWTDAERDAYRVRRPDLKDEDWVANTRPDPRRPAKGYVPYHPFWERLINYGRTDVDLDIPALATDLKAMGMGLCLYLHGLVLEANDMEELFALYESWGVAGLKPGFVSWGSQPATDALRALAACAARHHLWLDIHDAQIPDGFERTWPNVMTTEGGGGEEGHHPVRQDVALPFTRCLAGPFDYTPRFFDPERTPAHAAAQLLVYPGPTAVLRWSRGGNATVASLIEANPDVFAFARALPMTYDETVVLGGEVAKWIVLARRKGGRWYVGALAGAHGTTAEIDFSFLAEGRPFEMRMLADGGAATRQVRRGERMAVEMRPGGGFAAVLTEKEASR